MEHDVVLIPGDGIGPEVTRAVQMVIQAAGCRINWRLAQAGVAGLERFSTPLPDATVEAIQATGVALKGPATTPVGTGFRSVNVGLRLALNLYANVRPVRNMPGIKSPWTDVDLVVMRENTEDLYIGLERRVSPDHCEATKVITRGASERIVRRAFEYARNHGYSLVTAGHKANILKLSDGLFLEAAREVAREFPEICFEDMIIDNLCMQLVRNPGRFGVIVLPNLYGDIVSDLCAGLVGGLGVVPGANIGDRAAVFEAVHGSAPDIAGQGKANPTALLLSAVMMLEFLGEKEAAARITQAVESVLGEGKILTGDLGGTATTEEITQAYISALATV